MKLKQRIVLGYLRLKLKLLETVNLEAAARAAFTLLCTPYTRKRIYTPPPIFEMGVQQSFVFQGHKIHGRYWKTDAFNGRTILICHGFDSASYKFAHYIQPLLNLGFKIIAFDAPAHGLSEGKTINVLIYRNFILEVVKLYGPIDGIMAHSFGGTAAALAAEQMPPGMLKRLILIAPATETTRSISDFCRILHISERLQKAMEQLIVSIGGQPVSWYSVNRIVQSVHTPTLWLHDEMDTITPYTDMAHLQDLNLSHLSITITKGLGHSLYNNNDIAHKIINFMNEMLSDSVKH